MTEMLYFETIKESREWYFVKYMPPVADHRFATISLVFPNGISRKSVGRFLNEEATYWIKRYPVPVMASAWDEKEDMVRPVDQDDGFLYAWSDTESGAIKQSWNSDELSLFLKGAPPPPDWRTIYTDVPVQTASELKAAVNQKYAKIGRRNKRISLILALCVGGGRAASALFGFFGPAWFGVVNLARDLWEALRTGLRITGRIKPSQKEKQDAEELRKLKQYEYHCKRNPKGFARIMVENLEQDAREQVRKEAEELGVKLDR